MENYIEAHNFWKDLYDVYFGENADIYWEIYQKHECKESISYKLYVRHSEKSYFDSCIKSEELKAETNIKDEEIAYYYEKQLPDDIQFVSVEEIFQSNNLDTIRLLCELLFVKKCYNIFGSKSMKLCDGQLQPINPFTAKDKAIIFNNDTVIKASVDNVVAFALKQYHLYRIGNKFDFVLLGGSV